MSKAILNPDSLEFLTDTNIRKVIISADTNSISLGGNSSADVSISGVSNISISGQEVFYDQSNKSISLSAPPTISGDSYNLSLPPAQGPFDSFLRNDGTGTLTWQTIVKEGSDYMIGNLSTTFLTNLTIGNHAPFDQAFQSPTGTNTSKYIYLDTSSPYSTNTNTPSLGRITLKANLTYLIVGIIKSLADVEYYGYTWYNSDTNTKIGTRGEGFAATSQASSISSTPSYCTITPIVDTRIELRLTDSSCGYITNWYSGSDGYGETMFSISVATSATTSNSFVGASPFQNGTQGFVPAPHIGQQNLFLRANGTWGNSVFPQSTPNRSPNDVIFNTNTKQLEFHNGTTYSANNIATISATGQTGNLSDRLVIFSPPTQTPIDYTLPDPSPTTGTITKYLANSGTIVLTAPPSRTVGGNQSFTLSSPGDYVTLISNGSDWMVLDKPTGLLLLRNTQVTNATAVTLDNVFSGKYSSYVVEANLTNSGGSGNFQNVWALRRGGATLADPNYNMYYTESTGIVTGNTNLPNWSPTGFFKFSGSGDYVSLSGEVRLGGIVEFLGLGNCTVGGAFRYYTFGGNYGGTADGLAYTSTSGTISGYIKIYAKCV